MALPAPAEVQAAARVQQRVEELCAASISALQTGEARVCMNVHTR